MQIRNCFILTLICVACRSDSLALPGANYGMACVQGPAPSLRGLPPTDTLLRFEISRGPRSVWSRTPRLFEALYDSSGRPLQLASIDERWLHSGSISVEVLLVEFGTNQRLTASRLLFGRDSAQRIRSEQQRARERFYGKSYLLRDASQSAGDSSSAPIERAAETLTREQEAQARALAAQFWELRCPRNSPLRDQ